MAKLLAVESSTVACSVALNNDGVIDERFLIAPQQHTQRLLPMVDELLKANRVVLSDLDAIIYSCGPGSFTGLRIGLGVVQGLAFGASLPVIKVSSLELLAFGICREQELPEQTLVIPAFNAHMSEVYWGVYRYQEASMEPVVTDSVSRFEGIDLTEHGAAPQKVIAVGDGWQDQSDFEYLNIDEVYADVYPHAADLARLGAARLEEGKVESVFEAAPTYVRKETTWKKRQRIR